MVNQNQLHDSIREQLLLIGKLQTTQKYLLMIQTLSNQNNVSSLHRFTKLARMFALWPDFQVHLFFKIATDKIVIKENKILFCHLNILFIVQKVIQLD